MSDSFWVQTTPDAACPSLAGSHEADVAIIGGGLTGLHCALKILESNPGIKVTLIESDRICGDASGRTMGKVTTSHSRIFAHLSADKGKLYAQANEEGFTRILKLIEKYGIECDLQRAANYIIASTNERIEYVRKDFEAMKQAGLNVKWVEPQSAEALDIRMEFLAGIRHPDQAIYHPRKFALGLLDAIRAQGGAVYEHSLVTGITEHREGVTVAINGGGSVEAKKVIVATRTGLGSEEPFSGALTFRHGHVAAYWLENNPLRNAYIRFEQPVSSVRANKAHLILGGGDAEALPFEDEKHYLAIEAWAQQAYPRQGRPRAEHETIFWWGEDGDSADLLPLIGTYRRGSKHTFMAAGYSGWGMTKSAFAGIMLADLVVGKASPYQAVFDPWR